MKTSKMKIVIILVMLIALPAAVLLANGQQAESTKKTTGTDLIEMDLFVNHTWFWTSDWKGAIAEEITKRTGVKMNVERANDNQQLPVMIASGSLPEMIYTSAEIERLSDSRLCYPWNELIDQYATDFPMTSIEVANHTQEDGNFYTLRNFFWTEEQWLDSKFALPGPGTHSLHYRTDLWEELGSPSITSLSELESVLEMAKAEFPEVIPYVHNWGYEYFQAQHGMDVGNTHIYPEGDKIYHRLRHPALLETLIFMNRLIQKDLTVPENFTWEYEQFQQQVYSGNAFSFSRSAWESNEANDAFKKAGLPYQARIVQVELSNDAVWVNDGIGWSATFITKNNENPDRAIQFMKFMRQEEGRRLSTWGIEGRHWNLGDDGRPIFTEEYLTSRSGPNFYEEILGGVWTFGVALEEQIQGYDPENWPEVTPRLQAAKVKYVFRPELHFVVPRGNTEEANIYSRIEEFAKNEEIRIIISAKNESEVREMYAEMISQAEKMGLNTMEAWMTDKYAEVMKRYQ